jgi:hypothetical protein
MNERKRIFQILNVKIHPAVFFPPPEKHFCLSNLYKHVRKLTTVNIINRIEYTRVNIKHTQGAVHRMNIISTI